MVCNNCCSQNKNRPNQRPDNPPTEFMKTSLKSPNLFGRNHWIISSTVPISITKQPEKIMKCNFVTLTTREIKRPRNAYSTKWIRSTHTSKLRDKYVNKIRGEMIRRNFFALYLFWYTHTESVIKNEKVSVSERRFNNSFEIKLLRVFIK